MIGSAEEKAEYKRYQCPIAGFLHYGVTKRCDSYNVSMPYSGLLTVLIGLKEDLGICVNALQRASYKKYYRKRTPVCSCGKCVNALQRASYYCKINVSPILLLQYRISAFNFQVIFSRIFMRRYDFHSIDTALRKLIADVKYLSALCRDNIA